MTNSVSVFKMKDVLFIPTPASFKSSGWYTYAGPVQVINLPCDAAEISSAVLQRLGERKVIDDESPERHALNEAAGIKSASAFMSRTVSVEVGRDDQNGCLKVIPRRRLRRKGHSGMESVAVPSDLSKLEFGRLILEQLEIAEKSSEQ
jgi:hypothetical protein